MQGKRIALIHYDADEGATRLKLLRRGGYIVELHAPRDPQALRTIVERPPDGVVVDFSRRASNAQGAAVTLRQRKATRRVPMVLVGGTPEIAARLRSLLPDVAHVDWRRIRGALTVALRRPPVNPHVPNTMAGYSGTPLAKKLGMRAGQTVAILGAPRGFNKTLGDMWKQIQVKTQARGRADMVMLFVKSRAELAKRLPIAARTMVENGAIWIAWPKKTSEIAGDITQAQVRETGLTAGLVDYKICAIDETWSGLRFARRKPGRSSE